ncbi:Uncharacterised protein [Chlamydia trachomatis]|nr:Uncharacterised protein [Chlamydia trachomatis]
MRPAPYQGVLLIVHQLQMKKQPLEQGFPESSLLKTGLRLLKPFYDTVRKRFYSTFRTVKKC